MTSSTPINGLPDEYSLLTEFQFAPKIGNVYKMSFKTQQCGKFEMFSKIGGDKVETKKRLCRGLRLSCVIQSEELYHTIIVTLKINFRKLCGLFNLVVHCEGRTLQTKLENFSKLPWFTKEEKNTL